MKIKCGGLTFTSDFDSGNLDRVEFVSSSNKPCVATEKGSDSSSSSQSNRNVSDAFPRKTPSIKEEQKRELRNNSVKVSGAAAAKVNGGLQNNPISSPARYRKCAIQYPILKKKSRVLEFKIWTKPDCGGTPFENSFRSWFHFGVEGGLAGTTIKVHVMNLNRQGKLFFYGMRPVYKVVPAKDSWKRIPGKVSYKNESDGNFVISFMHTLPSDPGSVIYFAFTYPFSYDDCQKMLDNIDCEFSSSPYASDSFYSEPPEDAVYYCRELLCYSLDGRRIDLLTVTSCKGLTKEREERLPHLFPDHLKPRCHVFCGKKVIFVSSRVHPGETPSSFVFNGFLKSLLRPSDPRAIRLRHLYVFKLIPMLNPDGVYRGHFRTDSRGINLNRMYLIASPDLHPSVYASRALLLHYHTFYSSLSISGSEKSEDVPIFSRLGQRSCDHKTFTPETQYGSSTKDHNLVYSSTVHSDLIKIPVMKKVMSSAYSLSSVQHSVESSDDFPGLHQQSNAAVSVDLLHKGLSSSDLYLPVPSNHPQPARTPLEYLLANLTGNLGSKSPYELRSKTYSSSFSGFSNESSKEPVSPSYESQLSVDFKDFKSSSELEASDADEEMSVTHEPEQSSLTTAARPPYLSPDMSGIAYYFDLHGHACKRGCFIYGNFFPDIEQKVECMLLAKLMSINCPYFDFSACNFSAENMCSGSKRDGQSKEGSGRVSLHTFTGVIHSYTLECNYNTGPNFNFQGGGGEPSSSRHNAGKSSVIFTPEIFSKVGEALLVSILDATSQTLQSRVPHSSLRSLGSIRTWLRKYVVAVSKQHKNNYLKKNLLGNTAGGLNLKGKAPHTSADSKKKISCQDQSREARMARLAACPRKNVSSPSISSEKFLINFGMKCKRLHASSSSPEAQSSPPSKCIDGIKKLLNPKDLPLSSSKSYCHASRSIASSSLKPLSRKSKGISSKSSKYCISTKASTSETKADCSRKVKSDPLTRQQSSSVEGICSVHGELKKPFVIPIESAKPTSRSKKKSLVSVIKSSLPTKGLLESAGNIRAKKKMQV